MRRSFDPRAGRARDSLAVSSRSFMAACLLATCLLVEWSSQAQSAPAAPPPRQCVTAFVPAGVVEPPDSWELRRPSSVAVDHRGQILIADTGDHRVVGMTADGDAVLEFGGYGWDEGQFDGPTDLAVYGGFFTYVLDEGNRRVERFDVYGDYIDLVVGEGDAGSPVAIAVGRSGELYIIDADSQSILVQSQFQEALAPVGQFGTGAGGLVRPIAVAVGPRGEIGVADPGRASVVVFDEFGTELYEIELPDTLAATDLVLDPWSCAVVVEPGARRVVAYPPGGGAPTASLDLEDGFVPVSIAIDEAGSLYVLDGGLGRVLVLETTHGECAPVRR